MAGETEVNIVLQDGFSGETEKVRVALKRVKEEAKKSMPLGKKAIEALERTAQNIGREIGSSIQSLGITSALVGGGFVASLAKIASSLDRFSGDALQSHAVARETGLPYEQFERFVLAAKARGLSDDEARQSVERFARSIKDLALGNRSATRDRLEDASFRDTGTVVARELQASLARNGLEATMLEVLGRMSKKAGEGEEGQWAAKVLGESMGLNGAAWIGLSDTLAKIDKVVVPNEDASRKYRIASRKLEQELNKLRNKISAILVPVFANLMKLMAASFSKENTAGFSEWLQGLVKSLLEFPWDKLRRSIDAILSYVGSELLSFVEGLADFIEDIDRFFQFVDRWREGNRNRGGGKDEPAPIELPELPVEGVDPGVNGDDGTTPLRFGSLGGGRTPISADYQKWQLGNASDLPLSENIEDRRGEFADDISQEFSDDRLTNQTKALSFQMRRLVDVMRDLRGGAGGGSSDGGVSAKNRSPPMDTKAGGAGAPATEDQTMAGGKMVAPGTPPAGPRVVKGSFFGNFPKALGSAIGWHDPDDTFTSGPNKGQPKPNYGGYGQDVPGVAIPYKGSAGPVGAQAGAPVRVWDPRPGKPSVMARQVDIGPNQVNPRSRDKGLDVNAALAERLGFAPNKKTAQETGRDVFPTGNNWKYQVLRPEDILRARTEMSQERQRIAGQSVKFSRRGSLEMDINVNGPRGVSVGASTSGDLATDAYRGININRGSFSDRFEAVNRSSFSDRFDAMQE